MVAYPRIRWILPSGPEDLPGPRMDPEDNVGQDFILASFNYLPARSATALQAGVYLAKIPGRRSGRLRPINLIVSLKKQ